MGKCLAEVFRSKGIDVTIVTNASAVSAWPFMNNELAGPSPNRPPSSTSTRWCSKECSGSRARPGRSRCVPVRQSSHSEVSGSAIAHPSPEAPSTLPFVCPRFPTRRCTGRTSSPEESREGRGLRRCHSPRALGREDPVCRFTRCRRPPEPPRRAYASNPAVHWRSKRFSSLSHRGLMMRTLCGRMLDA